MDFEWDPEKSRRDADKHRIAFEDAARVFEASEACLELFDGDHSDDEERFITIGPIAGGIVVVVWTERAEGATRLISARWATPRESRLYHRRMESLR